MTTAIDSNILIDLIGGWSGFTADSIAALDATRAKGALTICPVVAAEVSVYFETYKSLEETLRAMQIMWVDFTLVDAHKAGMTFVQYRRKSSKPKDRMLADFLVGAHALHHADALLTRDRGYYRTFFPELKLIEPVEKLT
jgi:predicted nucleic acid-binding protein